jgi:plastocyanin
MKTFLFTAAAIVAVASPAFVSLALAQPTAPAQSAGHVQTIDIKSFMFMSVTVPAGTTVTWTNRDDIPHTVVAKDKSWRSAALDTGDSFSRKFDTPGNYDYFCSLHPQMVGRITVVAAKK